MNAALQLIKAVEANGGTLRIDGNTLVIAPDSAGVAIIAELRQHKREIIQLLERRMGMRADDPEEWRSDFVLWLDSDCTLHPRCFSGLSSLHLAFCEWEQARREVPCTRETFAAMLYELGFLMGEVEGTTLVSGLILKDDLEATWKIQRRNRAREIAELCQRTIAHQR